MFIYSTSATNHNFNVNNDMRNPYFPNRRKTDIIESKRCGKCHRLKCSTSYHFLIKIPIKKQEHLLKNRIPIQPTITYYKKRKYIIDVHLNADSKLYLLLIAA